RDTTEQPSSGAGAYLATIYGCPHWVESGHWQRPRSEPETKTTARWPPSSLPRSNCRQAFFVLRRRIATAPTRPAPKSESVRGSGTFAVPVMSNERPHEPLVLKLNPQFVAGSR